MEKKGGGTKVSPTLSDMVKHEVNRILKGEQPEQVNFAHVSDFCFNLNVNSSMPNTCWIIDTGATTHICAYYEHFVNFKDLGKEIKIYMPNGNVRTTRKYGDVPLDESLILRDILYVPSFKLNLLSVGKILQNRFLECCFYADLCTFQDQRTSKVIAMGRLKGNLYVLYSMSFNRDGKSYTKKF